MMKPSRISKTLIAKKYSHQISQVGISNSSGHSEATTKTKTKKAKTKKSSSLTLAPEYLQCSFCGKWRTLPLQSYSEYVKKGIDVSAENFNWTCSMSTRSEYNNCSCATEEGCEE